MNRKIPSVVILMSLALVIISIMPATGQTEVPVISVVNPSNETADFTFASNTPVGYKFNATVRVSETINVSAWEVKMNYNATILNAVQAFIPTWDTQYIFYGTSSYAPNSTFESGSVLMGATTTPVIRVDFTTPKKLAIVEFEVSAKPPSGLGNSVSSILNVNDNETYLLNPDLIEITCAKENGYYELNNKQASQVSMTVNPTSVNVGGNLTINGTISTVPANFSVAFPNEQVTVWQRIGTTDAFTTLATVFTGSTNRYSYTMLNVAYGLHQFEVSWNGNSTYQGTYSVITSVQVSKFGSTITLTADPTSVQAGSSITLQGSITPPRPSVNVTIYSGRTAITTVTTASNGSYFYSWTTAGAGTFDLTARWGGDATYNGAVSAPVTVNVAISPWLYITIGIVAIAIVIIIAIVAYYLRKRSKTPKMQRKPSRPIRTKSIA